LLDHALSGLEQKHRRHNLLAALDQGGVGTNLGPCSAELAGADEREKRR
jgi:hypothetical protein